MADHRSLTQSALSFFSGTAISRISGLARDMSMAFFFGTSPSIAAFLVAYRLANLLRRIFGEGALLNSLIPHFETYRKDNPKQAAAFFRDVFFSVLTALILIIGLIEISLFLSRPSPENREIFNLIMIILPGVIFICLFSVCSGLMHCEKNFFATSISPIAFNLVWILAIFLNKDVSPSKAATGLSIGITLGFFCQWIFIFPKTLSTLLKELTIKELFQWKIFSSETKRMLLSLSLGIIGVVATQINTALDTIFARYASLEGPAYLNYAMHLHQLPLALIGIAISTALLPPLSRAFKSEDRSAYNQLLEFSLSIALFLIIPCAMAIFVLGSSSVNLIFGRGIFDHESTLHTLLCLWGYGLGLIPMVATLLFAPAFYAQKNYKIPTLASIFSILMNFALNFLLVRTLHLGVESLPLSTTFASFCNAYFLYRYLNPHLSSPFYLSLAKTSICALLSGLITLGIGYYLKDPTIQILLGKTVLFERVFTHQIIQFSLLCLIYFTSFFGLSFITKQKELFYLLQFKNQVVS